MLAFAVGMAMRLDYEATKASQADKQSRVAADKGEGMVESR